MKYRKKPVVVEAEQLTWENWSAVCQLIGEESMPEKAHGVYLDAATGEPLPAALAGGEDDGIGLIISTLEGEMLASQGDWIIRGVQGELYPCKPDIFDATYEAVAK